MGSVIMLKCFVIAAAEQFGKTVNLPGHKVSQEYKMKKETVMMAKNYSLDDNTKFVPLTMETYLELLSKLPLNKSPDYYRCQVEHIKFASDETYIQMMNLINDILSDITQYHGPFISLSLANYIHKGKGCDPSLMKSY